MSGPGFRAVGAALAGRLPPFAQVAPGLLVTRDFTLEQTATAPRVESPAATHRVPNGRILRLGSNRAGEARARRYRLMLQTAVEFLTVASSAGGVLTLDIGAAGSRFSESPDFPGVAGIQIATSPSAAPGWVLQASGALTMDYATQIATVTGLAASTNFDAWVYGFNGDSLGLVRLLVQAAGGQSRVSRQVLDEVGVVELHESSQVFGDQMPELSAAALALAADELVVNLDSDLPHVPPQVLNPGGVNIGNLTRLEFRPNIASAGALLTWARRGAPFSEADLIAAVRAMQSGAALPDTWRGLPEIPGLSLGA